MAGGRSSRIKPLPRRRSRPGGRLPVPRIVTFRFSHPRQLPDQHLGRCRLSVQCQALDPQGIHTMNGRSTMSAPFRLPGSGRRCGKPMQDVGPRPRRSTNGLYGASGVQEFGLARTRAGRDRRHARRDAGGRRPNRGHPCPVPGPRRKGGVPQATTFGANHELPGHVNGLCRASCAKGRRPNVSGQGMVTIRGSSASDPHGCPLCVRCSVHGRAR